MHWTDVEEIAEALEEKYPNKDVYSIRFTLLKKMILDLSEFNISEDECNEKTMEAIQAQWIELQDQN